MPAPPATYRYLVLSPILHPVAARDGDVLIVRPGHADRPIVVVREIAGAWRPIRVGPPNFGALIVREDDGFIYDLSGSPSSIADHPVLQIA